MAKAINIKLVRSVIGSLPKQRKTIEALGLKKIGQNVEKPDNPQIRGMINIVKHMVEVTEI
ncbi:50S ribosomal protein L30 [Alkaliphilus hydrothermalis]|uniref:Large ribosomal subunit protein uL30 n=1 Tax=Alkaliphilus hydrothermalis TaxID=1482730 RepID=A0ABS2NQQ7_9FIRM|nr:50S ribosomal protein L30 [Alkaliphilus hydrothermalis]MBM7615285.1 large subunit ribosomal protein L30 [Alkaliphilus hydrothermalis]